MVLLVQELRISELMAHASSTLIGIKQLLLAPALTVSIQPQLTLEQEQFDSVT
jgi:hypothetical protein